MDGRNKVYGNTRSPVSPLRAMVRAPAVDRRVATGAPGSVFTLMRVTRSYQAWKAGSRQLWYSLRPAILAVHHRCTHPLHSFRPLTLQPNVLVAGSGHASEHSDLWASVLDRRCSLKGRKL